MRTFSVFSVLLIGLCSTTSYVVASEPVCAPMRTATLETVKCVIPSDVSTSYIQRTSPIVNNQYEGLTQIFYPESVCDKAKNVNCIWQEQPYSAGKLNGLAKTYYPNGQVKEYMSFSNGIPNGETALFNKDGQLMTKSNYVNGALTAMPVWLDLNGNPRQGTFTDSNELGNQFSKAEYKDGFKHGQEIIYEIDEAKPRIMFTYVNGVKEGEAKIFNYPNGEQELAESVMYKNDRRNGLYRKYVKGKLAQEDEFVNDVLEGEERFYTTEGKLLSITPYVNGSVNGVRKIYYPNGKIKFADTYVNGKRDGEMLYYDDQGNVIKKEMYRNDTLIN